MKIALIGDSLTFGRPGASYAALLRRRLPSDSLLNLGRPNDTVISLHRRLARLRINKAWDLAFLWIGVNDVPGHDRWLYRAYNTLVGQRRARNMNEFRDCYRASLDLICTRARHVIVAPPALKGESLESYVNRHLIALARWIEELTADYERVEFLDLQEVFAAELTGRLVSDKIPRNPLSVFSDVLTLRSDKAVDRMAAERGLHLTLDGVHLNSTGAKLVALELSRLVEARRQVLQAMEIS
jgi:lysophospholipase L1-like esterase